MQTLINIRTLLSLSLVVAVASCGDDDPLVDSGPGSPPDAPAVDSSSPPPDGASADSAPPVPDAAVPDAAVPDAAAPDAAVPDAAVPDAFIPPDAARPDAAIADAAIADAATPDASPFPPAVVTDVGPARGAAHGMAIAEDDGRIFISDTFGSTPRRVYVSNPPYTGPLQPTPISGPQPAGLFWENGSLFVCEVSTGTVTQYRLTDFKVLAMWQADTPWNVARDAGGDLLTASFNNKVQRLVDGGPAQTLFQGLLRPFDLQPMPDGTVWVSEQGAVQGAPGQLARRMLDGTIVELLDFKWANPEGLALTDDGTLWVAETERDEIIRVKDGLIDIAASGENLPVVIIRESPTSVLYNLAQAARIKRVTVQP